MKNIILKRIILIILILLILIPSTALAHSGRTDSSGGHHDRSNGTYHYHHGFPAHQHPNGVCPYASSNNQSGMPLSVVIILTIIGLYILYKIYCYFSSKKSHTNTSQKALVPQPIQKPNQLTITLCPKCGSRMVLRNGRYGSFYGCTRYPYCKGTRRYL